MDLYKELNARFNAAPVFNLVARRAIVAAQNDISAPENAYTHELNDVLKSMADRPHEEQIDTVRGIAKAWENTMPAQMMRIAHQLHALVNQQWFRYDHAAHLIVVAEKFGAFAAAHDNDEALSVARSAFRFKSFGLETLKYVIEKGAENARRTPKATAPSVLRLAA